MGRQRRHLSEEERRMKRRMKRIVDMTLAWVLFIVLIGLAGYGVVRVVMKGADRLDFSWVDKTQTISASQTTNPNDTSEPSQNTDNSSKEQDKDNITSAIQQMVEDEIEIEVPDIPASEEPSEEELFEAAIERFIASMSLEDKVAGLFIVSPEQLTGVSKATKAGDGTKVALDKYAVGGIIYSDINITKEAQFKEMVSKTAQMARYPLFLALDEEPGNTVLAKKLKLSETNSAAKIGAGKDALESYLAGKTIAEYLNEYGINLNLGIVAEAATGAAGISSDRLFGSNKSLVGPMVTNLIKAYKGEQINTAIKYFPGQAGGAADTAYGMSVTQRSKDEMDTLEIPLFADAVAAGADIIVVSHVSAPKITGDNTQCSRSKYIMSELIRKEMGLEDIIIMTDAMNKAAITEYYESGEACITSIKAGADMILLPENFEDAYREVLNAVNSGVIAKERVDDSLKRIYKVKFKGKNPDDIDAMIQQ